MGLSMDIYNLSFLLCNLKMYVTRRKAEFSSLKKVYALPVALICTLQRTTSSFSRNFVNRKQQNKTTYFGCNYFFFQSTLTTHSNPNTIYYRQSCLGILRCVRVYAKYVLKRVFFFIHIESYVTGPNS